MDNLKDFLIKFYDETVKEGEYPPVYVTDTKEDWVEKFLTGGIVDGCFIYADTMSVLMSSKESCSISLFMIKEDFTYLYENLTLRFDRNKATICGFDRNIDIWDYEDEIEMEDYPFEFSKNMEKSVLKQLQNSLNNQFMDEMFKDHLSSEEKREVQQFMKMSKDFLDLDSESYNLEEYQDFIKKFKLENEIETDGEEFKLKPSVLVDLERTKDVFDDRISKDEKFECLKVSLKNYVQNFLNSKGLELEFSVEGYYDSDFGSLYLQLEDEEFKHSFLERKENESAYEDAPSSWTWAAWLISEESPLVDEDFKTNYQENSLLQALDQFVHTLDESDFYYELEIKLKERE